jgi:hypothetical protein
LSTTITITMAGNVGDDVVVVGLAAGNVNGDAEGVAACVPGSHLRAGGAEDPAAHFLDLAGLFEDRDEFIRGHDAPFRVVPPE